ncbi:hypothetical protein [Persicobacter diffluens]
MKRRLNLNNNYFPVNESGDLDYEQGKWQEVMEEFCRWIDED